jgi:putative glutamine amidotransferase
MEDGCPARRAWAYARRAGTPVLHIAGRYNRSMPPRIAIPVPHSTDAEYAERALPQYVHAVEMAGGEPVRIPLDQSPAEVIKLIGHCDAVLLPGSKADVDPTKYKARTDPKTAPADPGRDAVDELLLRDAYDLRKPILGICYGLQILNVFRGGTLLQHIESLVNHEAGKSVPIAHTVTVDSGSKLSEIVVSSVSDNLPEERTPSIAVNSSHHQAAEEIGHGLRVVARCEQDGIIEALEGTSPDHFVLAVQWHPERAVEDGAGSRAIFRALVEAARR